MTKVVGVRETVDGLKRMGIDIAKELDKVAGRQAMALRTAIQGNVRANFGRTRSVGGQSQRTAGVSGGLEKSWIVAPTTRAGQRTVGSAIAYSRIHERGGIIRPRRRRNLAIPIGNLEGSPTKHPGLRLAVMGGTMLFLDASGKAQYVLKKQVTIPRRPYVEPAVERRRPKLREAVMAMLTDIKRRHAYAWRATGK